ncbi:hypothetical protein QUV83_08245 [Cellulomonas cellasea]|uniref:hypothetical protein n=1 Tax=Cellulomonas cellasea TaxID=43670 RepID=UPI0025A3D1BC|nr:hypothetical protein [Cellulomonas cellasea]MDM8084750.1 hypothetical protein [Cellulomonas cellasea]
MTREWWTFSRIWMAVVIGALVVFAIVAAVASGNANRERTQLLVCIQSGTPAALCD